MPADAATIRSTIEAYCAAFTAGDRDGYVGQFTDDAWIEDPVGSPRLLGHEAIGGFFDQSRSLAETIELRQTGPVRVAAAGGEAAFPMQARPVIGGDTYCVDIIDVMTFDDDGKITTMRAFWDPAEMRPADD
jgi:steroid Delta-isomerase